jgi:hypothetical protein
MAQQYYNNREINTEEIKNSTKYTKLKCVIPNLYASDNIGKTKRRSNRVLKKYIKCLKNNDNGTSATYKNAINKLILKKEQEKFKKEFTDKIDKKIEEINNYISSLNVTTKIHSNKYLNLIDIIKDFLETFINKVYVTDINYLDNILLICDKIFNIISIDINTPWNVWITDNSSFQDELIPKYSIIDHENIQKLNLLFENIKFDKNYSFIININDINLDNLKNDQSIIINTINSIFDGVESANNANTGGRRKKLNRSKRQRKTKSSRKVRTRKRTRKWRF